ncbi:MAG: O-antigen ligase family protein [Methylococcales bacterium]
MGTPTETSENSIHSSIEYRKFDWTFIAGLFFTILLSGSVQYFNIYSLAAINFVLQLILLYKAKFQLSRAIVPASIFAFAYLTYSIILQGTHDFIYIAFRFHDIITAILLLSYAIVKKIDFKRHLEIVLIGLVAHGLASWILSTLAFNLFSQVPGIKSYRFLLFFGMNETSHGIHRSQGLFWEPGVYQIYLNVALHYFLFYTQKRKFALISFISIILTLSTTGVVLASIQLLVFLFGTRQRLSNKMIKIIISLPLLIVYLNFTQSAVNEKLFGSERGSFLAREFDARNGINVALQNPFGIGFNPENYQKFARNNTFDIKTKIDTDRGQTNGILILAYSTGIPWAILILTLTFRQKVFPKHSVLFFIVIFVSLLSEPLFYSPFVWLFPISAMLRKADTRIQRATTTA